MIILNCWQNDAVSHAVAIQRRESTPLLLFFFGFCLCMRTLFVSGALEIETVKRKGREGKSQKKKKGKGGNYDIAWRSLSGSCLCGFASAEHGMETLNHFTEGEPSHAPRARVAVMAELPAAAPRAR